MRSGTGFALLRGLPVGGSLEDFVRTLREVGRYFGHLLSQNAQGELVGHVRLDPKAHSDITPMIALACWQKARSGAVIASGVTVHDEMCRRVPHLLEPLYRGYHYHRLDEQGAEEESVTPYRVPVFSIRKGQLSCRYQRAAIAAGHRERGVPLGASDVDALDLFDEVANAPEHGLTCTSSAATCW